MRPRHFLQIATSAGAALARHAVLPPFLPFPFAARATPPGARSEGAGGLANMPPADPARASSISDSLPCGDPAASDEASQ